MTMEMFLWLAGMWLVGSFVYSIFGTQISIINRCSMKMYSMICNDTDYWYSNSCKRYMSNVKRKNRIIILVVSVLVVCFAPLIGACGFFIGLVLKWFFSGNATGINQNNIDETKAIFLRFAKPGMEEEFKDGLDYIGQRIKMDSIFRNV